MVGRKKKTIICDNTLSHEEDRISCLPEHLICEILYHLSTKDAVRTSVLSTRWRNLWESVPGLDIDSATFSKFDAFVSFAERCLDSHRESSDLTPIAHPRGWIRKLRLNIYDPYGKFDAFPARWIYDVTRRRIQHIDLCFNIFYHPDKIPSLSLYTCETLVHLRLYWANLVNTEFVSLPCLKIIHLEDVEYPNESTLEKLISCSPVLEDLTLIQHSTYKANVLHVRSQTLKRIRIHQFFVVIDAPLLQCLRTKIDSTKYFEIINLGFSTKLDIDDSFSYGVYSKSLIHDILTDISRVRDLVISNAFWKELVKEKSRGYEQKKDPKVMFSTVPQCMVTSLRFVELKREIAWYEGEIKLIRYLLKNSTILEKLRLDVYYTQKTKCAFLKELVAMPRCSSACEVLVL